ncbi:capsule biosynthesis protein [Allofrancisella guangzhouensis]|uniref:Capsule biosynthesis protein n=1 Tax=Allofrancisella guangzhouensis TaxID=594679 RepID=A0A0A8EBT3_9GAMM|nr:capsule biosynthesis protein [Allofrancisella guangzhouensis]AJC49576.1 capsule biosynthesis protein [Allofrancisella guangzhouensis]MBK2043940.1 capsule biosynthesis protein [Allofrancisella guangzhouensis]MBK2044947.1 capsule biosynthesis protein [Allofrancisella guangzhouensis]
MKIGFTNIYSFRPHVEHLYYLSKLCKDAGHEVYFLTCDSSVDTCYPRELKKTSKIKECSKCIIGGIRSYANQNITSIKTRESDLSIEVLDELTLSSSCTLTRTESEIEKDDDEVTKFRKKLYHPVGSVFESAKKWISDNNLDAVVCFNGRMELTRAVTYACEKMGVPFITHERTWFGDGLRLVPNNNCISIKQMGKIVLEYSDKFLSREQVYSAAKLIAQRFLQSNYLEWRVYNKDAHSVAWPTQTNDKKILVIPSSKNESAGNEEYETSWVDNTLALDDFIDTFNISSDQIVIRCHPNWSENIGTVTGERSLNLYKKWAEERNIYIISSEDKSSTYDLILQSDIVILNGGSSAVEAGACGKQVINLGPCAYEYSGFVTVYHSKEDMRSKGLVELSEEIVIRKTLRYVYTRLNRFPQFTDYVKAIETTKYKYYYGAKIDVLVSMFSTGKIQSNDTSYSDSSEFEDKVIGLLKEKNWERIASFNQQQSNLKPYNVRRRFVFRWVDYIRSKLPRGDR